MKTDTLLVEVRTEELPPPAVRVLAEKFPRELLNRLREGDFTESQTPRDKMLATPRRFAALIDGVQGRAKDRKVARRGPQVKDGLDTAGKHSPALQGFMRAVGVTDVTQLAREKEKGREYFVWRGEKPGVALADVLPQMVADSMRAISDFPSMTWGAHDYAFVRPVRGLVMMLGNKVIPGEVMGVKSGDKTRGHPVLSKQPVQFKRAEDYADTLRKANVIVDYDERAGMLNEFLENARRKARNADVLVDTGGEKTLEDELEEKLEEEVVAMCEKPSRHICAVGKAFWNLPSDYVAICLIKHQGCFPLYVEYEEASLRLSKFVFIADNEPKDPKKITDGATAVVHARLQDLAFYLQTDKKLTEKEAREKLDGIVYHRKLGSQAARAKRIVAIADAIGGIMKLNKEEKDTLERAAEVCKLDLPTMTVGEYPELAGKMAAYHFCGKERKVASVVERHSDNEFEPYEMESWQLPAIALFLADKLEKIVGMFLVGEKPAGRKDPHGLRRAAAQMTKVLAPERLGFPRSLADESAEVTQKLSLSALLTAAYKAFPADLGARNFDVAEAHEFISKRVSLYDMNAEIRNAVYALHPDYLDEIPKRCKALQKFLWRKQASALIAVNKRINNILRKSAPELLTVNASELPPVNKNLLKKGAEEALHKCVASLEKETPQLMAKGDYHIVLSNLADADTPIDEFFNDVMVNDKDAELRDNRLVLLAHLRAQLNSVADLARLSG